jgi:hypothetical protein
MCITDKIGKKGRIKNGMHAGFFVRIDDDSQNTGGYLILIWTSPSVGYDYWVENLTDLPQFLHESGWDIEWLE